MFCTCQVISDVTGDEFETFIDMLAKLHHLSSSLEGIGQIVEIITDQAELQSDFQVHCIIQCTCEIPVIVSIFHCTCACR